MPKPLLLLDFGCGGGSRLFKLLRRTKQLFAVGVDLSLEQLKYALSNAKRERLKSRVEFIRADVHFMPIRNSTFNCALIIDVLYLLRTFALSLIELHRVMDDGGLLLVVEKTFDSTRFPILFSKANKSFLIKFLSNKKTSLHGSYFLLTSVLETTLLKEGFKISKKEHIGHVSIINVLSSLLPLAPARKMFGLTLRLQMSSSRLHSKLNIGTGFLCSKTGLS